MPPAILFLAIALAFWPLATAGFTLWDDPSTVWQNPAVANANFSEALTSTDDAIFMPLTRVTWTLIAQISGQPKDALGSSLSPAPFHVLNLLVHFASALLLYRLLRKLTLPCRPALAGAFFFALHPMQVESVGWVSGLKDVLTGCLSLATINGYVDAAALPAGPARQRRNLACIAFFIAAVLAKPTAIVVPAIIVLMDLIALRRSWRILLRESIPLWLIAIVTATIAAIIQPALLTPPVPMHLRPLIACDALAFYLRQLAWPSRLCIDYGRTPQVVIDRTTLWIAPLAIAALCSAAVFAWRRGWRLEVLGLAIFAVALSPMLGWKGFEFQYYSTVADHYAYLAMCGAAMVFATLVSRCPKQLVAVGVTSILLALSVRSTFQSQSWRDTESLANHTLAVNAGSVGALRMLGGLDDLRADEAIAQARADVALAHWQAAIATYDRLLRIDPKHVPALDAAATDFWKMHRSGPPAHSREFEERAMAYWMTLDKVVPTLPEPLQSNFVDLPMRLGKIALDLDRNREAIAYYERALVAAPGDPNAAAGLRLAKTRLENQPTSAPATQATVSRSGG